MTNRIKFETPHRIRLSLVGGACKEYKTIISIWEIKAYFLIGCFHRRTIVLFKLIPSVRLRTLAS